VPLSDSNEVHGEFFAEIIGNQVSAVLGTEDAMNQDVRIGVSHESIVPTGLESP